MAWRLSDATPDDPQPGDFLRILPAFGGYSGEKGSYGAPFPGLWLHPGAVWKGKHLTTGEKESACRSMRTLTPASPPSGSLCNDFAILNTFLALSRCIVETYDDGTA